MENIVRDEKDCLKNVLGDKCTPSDCDSDSYRSVIQSFHVKHYSTNRFLKFDNNAVHPARFTPSQGDEFLMSILAFPFVTLHCASGPHNGQYLIMDSNGDISFGNDLALATFQYSPSLLGNDTFFLARALVINGQNQVCFLSFNNQGIPQSGVTLLDNDCIMALAPTNILPAENSFHGTLPIQKCIKDKIRNIKAARKTCKLDICETVIVKSKEPDCKKCQDKHLV